MVYLDAIGQIAYTAATRRIVGMCDDDDFVATIDEFLHSTQLMSLVKWRARMRMTCTGQLVDMAFNTSGLREEEVRDHAGEI